MGYVPDLHKIWVGTSDQQLMAQSNEFPGFYRYALIMEEASEAERNKASRPYDGMAGFSEEHKQRAAQLLVAAANLERGYQAFRGSGNLQVFQPQVNELGRLHRQWLSDHTNQYAQGAKRGSRETALSLRDSSGIADLKSSGKKWHEHPSDTAHDVSLSLRFLDIPSFRSLA